MDGFDLVKAWLVEEGFEFKCCNRGIAFSHMCVLRGFYGSHYPFFHVDVFKDTSTELWLVKDVIRVRPIIPDSYYNYLLGSSVRMSLYDSDCFERLMRVLVESRGVLEKIEL